MAVDSGRTSRSHFCLKGGRESSSLFVASAEPAVNVDNSRSVLLLLLSNPLSGIRQLQSSRENTIFVSPLENQSLRPEGY